MKIVKHIENLLLKENSVIVPDFGCFMANMISAHFGKVENLFLPPMRTLGFNPRVTINDSMLVQSYIETYSMSYPDAMKEIEREVAEIKAELTKNAKFEFEGIGTLSYDGKVYDFIPCVSGLLTPSIYGFDTLELTTLNALINAQKSDDSKVNSILKPSFEPSEEKKKSIFEKENDTPIVITIQRATLRKYATAAAVFALAVLSVVPMKYAASSMQNTLQASIISVNSSKQETSAAKVETTKKIVAKKQETKKVETAPKSAEGKYTIVLAAGVSLEGAKMYAEAAKAEGIAAEVDNEKKPMVIYGKFATQEDARAEINKHLDNPRFKIAWIKELAN